MLHFTFVVMKTYGERCTSSYRNVLMKEQNLSEEDQAYLKQMKKDKRYQRDVY